MKTILIGINSKYIHPNLALRYLKANTTYPVEIFEYTIKDSEDEIVRTCIEQDPDLIGFSVYIWNVEIIRRLLKTLRSKKPKINILLGGPEVSYVNEMYFEEDLVDFIIYNEGEAAFHMLLDALHHQRKLSHIPNLIYKDKERVIKTKSTPIQNLDGLKSPYDIDNDHDIQHKIQYVELSRGCPYKCSYCLASLEKGLRFFPLQRVKDTIDQLVQKGAKTFKFLDRSFNANHSLAQSFFEYIIEKHYQGVVFQFEINGDVLRSSLIQYLIDHAPKDYIRFEIGIQSTNEKVNQAVNRYQDTHQLIENIHQLKKSNVILHLDLIAGLPYEDLNSFKQTFNTIYQLFGDELQLGFLKILKGTDIYNNAKHHQINYHQAAPYEIIDSPYISKSELKMIHQVEVMLDIYWNKGFMKSSIETITKGIDAFDFYHQLYQFYLDNDYSTLRYGLDDVFIRLIEFLKLTERFNHTIDSVLKYDYLVHHPIKPKIYWNHPDNKNDIIRAFHLTHPDIPLDDLYKYAIVTDYFDGYLIISYHPDQRQIYTFQTNKKDS